MISIEPFSPARRDEWDAFVRDCADGTFFHLSGWQALYEQVFRHRTHYLAARRAGAISGVLPLVELRSRVFGHALVSLPFAVYGGVASDDGDSIAELQAAAVRLARELGVSHLELRNRARRAPQWPRQEVYVTFRRAILPEADANMTAIPRKQRAMVRKGIQRGLVSDIDADIDRFFELYADNQHRHGTPAQSRAYFRALKQTFGADCEPLIVRTADGQSVSGVLSFYFRDEVLPYYAGDVPAARDLAANDFKYWELMRRACERGLKVFDFGRSKRGTGSFDFKKNWGFEPADLHYEHCLFGLSEIPQNNPANPKYQMAIRAWRRLPRFVVDRLGPMLARHLG